MTIKLNYKELTHDDFDQVIALATTVHGDGYLDQASILAWYNKGVYKDINTAFVVYHDDKLVGFRITYAATQWDIDQWCTPEKWHVATDKVCYFKCNTVDENYRGHGIGGELLAGHFPHHRSVYANEALGDGYVTAELIIKVGMASVRILVWIIQCPPFNFDYISR